jgi:hypothetical protein
VAHSVFPPEPYAFVALASNTLCTLGSTRQILLFDRTCIGNLSPQISWSAKYYLNAPALSGLLEHVLSLGLSITMLYVAPLSLHYRNSILRGVPSSLSSSTRTGGQAVHYLPSCQLVIRQGTWVFLRHCMAKEYLLHGDRRNAKLTSFSEGW